MKHRFRCFCRLFLLAALCLGAFSPTLRATTPEELELAVQATGALLVNAQNGNVLFSRNPDTQKAPASTTKLMTALLTYQKCGGLNGQLTVAEDDTKAEPSNVPLVTGETVNVKDLVFSLLIGSDNDSALALARHSGGSAGEFVRLMNEKARALGCSSTNFINPNGLPTPGQLTTPRDLLRIFQAVLRVPELRAICQTKRFNLTTQKGTQEVVNHNKLLGRYEGMGPAKTGWTVASRHTYAASASRDGREFHLILLDSPNKWADAQILFNYAFDPSLPLPPGAIPKPLLIAAGKGRTPPAPSAASRKSTDTGSTADLSMRVGTPSLRDAAGSHTVRSGETISSICRKHGCQPADLLRLNPLADPDRIHIGQVLLIPSKN